MFKYQKYLIREGDSFQLSSFPGIEACVETVFASLSSHAPDHKAEMLISYLNKENFDTSSVAANPALARKIGSGELQSELQDIQSLFDCCPNDSHFKNELESYIRSRFGGKTFNY
ncbi:MAG: hypothetical protein ACM3VS_09940 [Candidatus Dadabacteria bacterium]